VKRILLISLLLVATLVLFFVARQALAKRAIEQELGTPPVYVSPLETTTSLEILPLYEKASANPELLSGHGVSYLIRTDTTTILFDVGNNLENSPEAPFRENMQKLGVSWNEIDRIVISHLHPDHVGGISAWLNGTIAMGDIFLPDDLGDRLIFVPAPVAFKDAIHATIPSLPAPDVATTGVLPYLESFPFFLFEPKGGEQALVVNVAGKGLVLITGGGHPTLEQLVDRAESMYNLPVVGVVGGLHYGNAKVEDLQTHVAFLQARQPRLVALSPHDSSPQVLATFGDAFPYAYQSLAVGESIHFP